MDTGAPPAGSGWEPERVIDTAAARELIGAEFGARRPGLRDADIEPLAAGWDNTVLRVAERGGDRGAPWVFRFPRREIAVPGVRREIAVLPRLAGLPPLPIPCPTLVAGPSERFPWPYWGARMIPGTELAETGLSGDARIASASGVGAFLAVLHAPEIAAEVGAGLPVDPLRRGDPGVRAPKARRLVGDLSLAYTGYAGRARAALLAAYGATPDPARETAARVLGIFLCAALADYAVTTGRRRLLAASLAGITRAVPH